MLFSLKAASILKISSVRMWMSKEYAQSLITEELKGLKETYFSLTFKEEEEESNAISSPDSCDSYGDSYFRYHFQEDEEANKKNEAGKFKISIELDNEIANYSRILSQTEYLKTCRSSTQFWIKNSNSMPKLSSLALLLLNIPASSAHVERFFSICGAVCKQSSLGMKDDLIILRSMLKANLDLLNEMNEEV